MSDETEAEALKRVLEKWKAADDTKLAARVKIKERKRDGDPPAPRK